MPRADNTTSGRCKPCGRAFTWASHCARLSEMICPGCGRKLTQTTSRLRVTFETISNDVAREQARKVRAEAETLRLELLARPGYVDSSDLHVGDVIGTDGRLARITYIGPVEPFGGRRGMLARCDYVYVRPRVLDGVASPGWKDHVAILRPGQPVRTYTADEVAAHIVHETAKYGLTVSA